MSSKQLQCPSASNSLSALWNATILRSNDTHDNGDCAADTAESASSVVNEIEAFISSLEGHLQDWAQLFTQVPNSHERRKEALGGAIKIKSAAKRIAKVKESLAHVDNDGAADFKDQQQPEQNGHDKSTIRDMLVELQEAFYETVLGLLEVSFPVDEAITNDDFKDAAALSGALRRMDALPVLTTALGNLFASAKCEPKSMAKNTGSEDSLAPGVLQMLEKSMQKQKKKEKKKGNSTSEASSANLKVAKTVWEQTEGRQAAILSEEVCEGLNWRHGIFLFGYIKHLLDQEQDGSKGTDGELLATAHSANVPVSKSSVRRQLFVDAMCSFHKMLLAQGPIPGDLDDPVHWQATSDGPHQDDTARMFYHGVYTSTHLRGLKHLAELSYWQWKHGGLSKEDAALAALINRKFVHVVRHIMPHTGWIADVEFDRIVEMETTTLASSEFSDGLNDKLNGRPNLKMAVVADKSKRKGRKGGGYSAGKDAAGSATSSTAPITTASSSDEG